MNPNDHTSGAPQGDSGVGDQNVERLLTKAYDPEMPDSDFVRQVGQHVLAEARREKQADDEQVVRPASRIKRRLLRWETAPWIIIVGLVILLVALPVRQTPPAVPDFYREGDIVWIDGKAYRTSDPRSLGNRFDPNSRRRGGPLTPAGAVIRPAKFVGNQGLRPRIRSATNEPPSVEIGESIATGSGERKRVTLPDGSTLYVNESTTVTVDDIRSISLQRGQVYIDVVPRDEKNAVARFVVKTPNHSVTALGTKFAAEAGDSTTSVLVTQGSVQVSRAQTRDAVSILQTPTRRVSLDVVPVPSPIGTTADSLGRKPQEDRTETVLSPERATQSGAFKSLSPLQGLKPRFSIRTWGLRPRLSAVAASRLNDAALKNISEGPASNVPQDPRLRVGLPSKPVVVRAGQQLSVDSKSGDESDPVVTAAARASHLLSWTKDLMAAAESPLVPASDHSGGSLVAIDPDGQEMRLSLREYHVDVHIEDGFARTTIDQTYFNHRSWRLEGKFYFPLPADASISRLAMYVNGKLMEGGMAERDHARNVFETIKHRSLDPALLEWVDGSTFKMRVFPLEGRQEKRIVLSYTQRLANHYGRMQYRFPTGNSKEKVRDRSVSIRLADGKKLKWQCDSHDLKASSTDRDVTLSTEATDVSLDRDIVVNLTEDAGVDVVRGSKVVRGSPDPVQEATEGLKNSGDLRSGVAGGSGDPPATSDAPRTIAARFSTVEHDDSKYFMVRYRPQLKTKPRGERRDWIFLFDADGSRDPLLARIQVDVIRTMLKNAEHEDRFAIVTAGTRTRTYSPDLRPATPDNVADAIKMLDRTHLIGALDLEKALEACHDYAKAAENPTLVHVGGGVPILGERRTHILLKRLPEKTEYVGVGVGKRWNRSFMKAAASETGGYFTQINPDEPVGWRAFDLMSTLNTPRLLDLHVDSDNEAIEFLAFSDSAIHGEEVCAVARVKPDQEMPTTVRVHGRLDGQPFDQTIEVDDVRDGAGYLPRQWAKLAIDAMVSENAEKYKSQIIELSKSMYVMSPFTSLLVLENDEMYEQYNVDRGRKDHWALYPCPEKIEVVAEPLVGPEPAPAKVERKESKPSPRTVLGSLLVRSGRYGYMTAVPSGIIGLPSFEFSPVTTTVFAPDGGTVLVGGIKRRADNLWSVTIDDIGPNVMFGLDQAGTPNGAVNFELTRGFSRTLDGTNSTNGEFVRRVYLDLAGEIPSATDVQTYLDNAMWETNGSDVEFESLIDLIRTTVRPDTWDEVGGPGRIQSFSTNLSLVISQTQTVHEQLQSYYKWHERVYPVGDLVLPVASGNGDGYLPISMYLPDQPPLSYPNPAVWEQLTQRRFKHRAVDLTRAGGARLKIEKALEDETTIEFVETPLGEIIDYLGDLHGIQIGMDLEALLPIGVSTETLVTRSLTGISLRSALKLLLRDYGATFTVDDEVLVITTPDAVEEMFGEEMLLPIRIRIAPPAWTNGRDAKSSAQLATSGLKDPRLIGLWSKVLRRRLEQGRKSPDLLYFTPPIGNDQRQFRHLLAYAPGMNTTQADILSVLDREAGLSNPPAAGKVDPNARELIDAARSRDWQTVVLSDSTGRELLRLQIDGRGRYRYERRTEHGLHETVVCDGEQLWHLYPELGLGARRADSRFHQGELTSLVPWHLPSADDLAVGADLTLVGSRTIAVVSHDLRDAKDESGKPIQYSRVHLVFAEDGRLAERRLVEMPSGKTIARVTYAEDGAVRVLDADGEVQSEIQLAVTPTAAPNLKPEADELVILPMPIRSAAHVYDSVAKKDATKSADKEGDVLQQIVSEAAFVAHDFARWPEEDALQLAAANHWEDPRGLQDVIAQRFFANGDRRIGFYVLLLSSGTGWDVSTPVKLNDETSVAMNPLADHPDSPLAHYITSQLKRRTGSSKLVPPIVDAGQDSFLGQLSEYRRLYSLWGRTRKATEDAEQARREVDELFDFINRCDSSTFAFTLLRRAQHHLKRSQLQGRIAEALLRFEKQGVTSYVVQYELARALADNGDQEKARLLFLRLYRDTLNQGVLPPIDRAFLHAMNGKDDPFDVYPFDTTEESTGDFSDLMKKSCERLIDQGRRPTAMALVWQCRQLDQTGLAGQLLDQTLSGVADHERVATTLAAIEYLMQEDEHLRADALLQPLLEDETFAHSSELWRLAAQIADKGRMLARALHYQQRAIELEFQQFDSTVNLQWVRDQHNDLLERYGKLAGIVAQPGSQTSGELVQDVVKTADRWRSLDNDPTTACNAAARVLTTLGQDELAWDYLTTPLALKPNEAAPWLALARSMRDEDEIEMADRAYAAAFEAEPTNAEILWDHARMLDQTAQSARAMQLYSQIAGSDWQPRFNSIREQAKSIVDRDLKAVEQ